MKTALVCIAKDEDNYLEDWIDWHLKLGYDDVFVMMNDWRTSLDTSRYAATGHKVHLIPFDGKAQQNNAYNSTIECFGKDYDWMTFIDADEYIVLKKHACIRLLFAEYSDFYGLALNWKLFGSNGIKAADYSKNVRQRFTRCQKGINLHVKTSLNLAKCRKNNVKVKMINPHFCDQGLAKQFTISPEREYVLGPFNHDGSDQIAYIAHYVTKSEEECKTRRSKIRADIDSPREEGWEAFFKNHDKNEVENLDLID